MSAKKENLDAFRRTCREHNLSVTPQRLAIYQILMKTRDHPSAEDVFSHITAAFPDMSLDTVYRTLTTFSEIGIVRVAEGYGQARRYDPNIEPHHHFRCLHCNHIVDFQEKSFDNLKIPATIRNRYAISNVKVILEGVCDQCKKG